jgi:hypothetical protein
VDATALITDWKRRLVAMATNPPYVFSDTPQHLAHRHLRERTTFAGYPEAAVSEVERCLHVRFPTVFRTYLLTMAKAPGALFGGSDRVVIPEAGPAQTGFEGLHAEATGLLRQTDPGLALPANAVVYLFHQGYTFLYLVAASAFDGPQMQWTEGEREPNEVAPTFAALVDAELRSQETSHREWHERGGYYLTLYETGGGKESFPALNSGDRPLHRAKRT